jgi:hypothetical protein
VYLLREPAWWLTTTEHILVHKACGRTLVCGQNNECSRYTGVPHITITCLHLFFYLLLNCEWDFKYVYFIIPVSILLLILYLVCLSHLLLLGKICSLERCAQLVCLVHPVEGTTSSMWGGDVLIWYSLTQMGFVLKTKSVRDWK